MPTMFNFRGGSLVTDGYASRLIRQASSRLNEVGRGWGGLSKHEYNAAAIVNGRLDWLDEDLRSTLISMDRDFAFTVVAVILENWDREMRLPADHADAPKGDQRVIRGE